MKLILIDDNGNESFNKEVKFVSCSFVTDKNTGIINFWQKCNGYEQLKGYLTVCEQVKKCEDAIGIIKDLKKSGKWEEIKKRLKEAYDECLDDNGKVINFSGRLK